MPARPGRARLGGGFGPVPRSCRHGVLDEPDPAFHLASAALLLDAEPATVEVLWGLGNAGLKRRHFWAAVELMRAARPEVTPLRCVYQRGRKPRDRRQS